MLLPVLLRTKFKRVSKQTLHTVALCVVYLIYDLVLIFSYWNTKSIIGLLDISSFNARIILISAIDCYSHGFVEGHKLKNIYHDNKLFMIGFISNIIVVLCNHYVGGSFVVYINIVFAVLQAIISILIIKSVKFKNAV